MTPFVMFLIIFPLFGVWGSGVWFMVYALYGGRVNGLTSLRVDNFVFLRLDPRVGVSYFFSGLMVLSLLQSLRNRIYGH
jgi:hypothetical protein